MSEKTLPIKIVDHIDDQNLNEISHAARCLEAIQQEYGLKHREAVMYTNSAADRVRLVCVFHGQPVLMLPPTDPAARLSYYVTVQKFLKRFMPKREQHEMIEQRVQDANDRIERSKRAKEARKRAAKLRAKS